MATFFGDDGATTLGVAGTTGYIYGCRYTLSEAATVNSIACRIKYISAIQSYRFALYASTANKPTTLLGVTAQIASTSGWTDYDMRTADLATPAPLAAGDYFLLVWCGVGYQGSLPGRDAGSRAGTPWYAGYVALAYHATNSPGNLSAWTSWGNVGYKIIANYTAAPTGCPVNLLKTHIFNKGVIQSG